MDAETELEQVNAAIARILTGGQSHTLSSGGGSRSATYANLETLYKRKQALENRIAAARGGLGGRLSAAW